MSQEDPLEKQPPTRQEKAVMKDDALRDAKMKILKDRVLNLARRVKALIARGKR